MIIINHFLGFSLHANNGFHKRNRLVNYIQNRKPPAICRGFVVWAVLMDDHTNRSKTINSLTFYVLHIGLYWFTPV